MIFKKKKKNLRKGKKWMVLGYEDGCFRVLGYEDGCFRPGLVVVGGGGLVVAVVLHWFGGGYG